MIIEEDITWFQNALNDTGYLDSKLGYGNAIMPYTDVKKLMSILGKQKIEQWLEQFEEADKKYAVELFTNIKYYDSTTVMNNLRLAYYDWKTRVKYDGQDIVFVGLGGPGKSGQLISYLFRTANDIPPMHFLSFENLTEKVIRKKKYIVLLDDFIGSGSQVSTAWLELINRVPADQLKGKFFLIAIAGSFKGVRTIEQTTGIIPIVVEKRKSTFWFDEDDNDKPMVLFFQKYGSGLYTPKSKDCYLGWENSCETVVFFYNVPNNTVPIIWSTGKSATSGKDWIPLFNRAITTGKKIKLELLSVLLQKWKSSQLFAEDYMIVSKILVETNISKRIAEYTCEYLFQLSEIATAFYQTNSGGGGGLEVHPLEVFRFLLRIRDDYIKYIADKTIQSKDFNDFTILFNCFKFEGYSAKQESIVQPIVKEEVCRTLSSHPRWIEKVIPLVNSENVYIANGAFRVLMSSRELLKTYVDAIKNLYLLRKNGTHNARFFVEHVLARVDGREPDLEEIDLRSVHMLVNCYGSIRIIPVSDFNRFGI